MRADTTFSNRTSHFTGSTVLLLGLALILMFSTSALAAEDINRVVLRVNNQVATLFDYEERKAVEITRILSNPNLDPNQRQEMLDGVGKNILQNLFSELLLRSYADQNSIRIKDEELQDALKQVMERQGITSRSELEEALAGAGLTIEQLQDNLRNDLLWNQVVGREVHSKIELGEEDLRAYYRNNREQFEVPERRWLKEIIVLETADLSGGALAEKATEIHRELASGADFEEAAATYQEQGVTTGVIDLDWLTAGDLEDTLSTAAWQLKKGQYSAPVEGRGGLHIFYLEDHEEASVRPFKEVEDVIMQRERSVRFQKELRDFMVKIEKHAYVQENLPPEAVGYRTLSEGFEVEDELGGFLSPLESEGASGEGGEEEAGEESGE